MLSTAKFGFLDPDPNFFGHLDFADNLQELPEIPVRAPRIIPLKVILVRVPSGKKTLFFGGGGGRGGIQDKGHASTASDMHG